MKWTDLFFKKRIQDSDILSDKINSYKVPKIDATISDEQILLYNASRDGSKLQKKIICSAPLKNMYFSRHGNVYTCCHNRDYTIGKFPDQSIAEIWNSSKADLLRKHIASDNMSLGCQVCQLDFDKSMFNEVKARHFDQLPFHPDFPTMMEFELDIVCNLECTMCSGEFSSSIRKNREKIPAFHPVYGNSFIDDLKTFIPYLHETRFSGGEPFLIPIYLDIWEKIVTLNANCLISVQTNGTVMNTRIRKILEKGRFEIGVSLDSLRKEVFEDIRINAKFETVIENIRDFADYSRRKNTSFRLSMCVMRNNWMEMPEYLKFCNDHNAYLCFHKVIDPVENAIWNLSSAELMRIHDFLQESKIVSGEDQISKTNLLHFQNYMLQILEWANLQKLNEEQLVEWGNLSLEALKHKFYKQIESYLQSKYQEKNDSEVLTGKLDDLLNQFSTEDQRFLILELKNRDTGTIVQRLKLKTLQNLKDELNHIYFK